LQTYFFAQEYDFYYLTGHNEEGAGLIILPAKNIPASDGSPAKFSSSAQESRRRKMEWRPQISFRSRHPLAVTGFSAVKPFSDMRPSSNTSPNPTPPFIHNSSYRQELGGFPHEKAVTDWLASFAPQAKLKEFARKSKPSARSNPPAKSLSSRKPSTSPSTPT